MIGSVTKNGGRREMETNDRVCDQNGGGREMEAYWKLMIGSVTKNGERRESETYDRICGQKWREKRNGNL